MDNRAKVATQVYLSTKVVVLGIEEANEGGVDGGLLRHLDGTVTQDLENLALVVVDVGLKHAGQTLQITLQGGGALRKVVEVMMMVKVFCCVYSPT